MTDIDADRATAAGFTRAERPLSTVAYHATTALREQLKLLNGSASSGPVKGGGYINMLHARLVPAGGRKVSDRYVQRLVLGYQAAPLWFVLAATRVAEENYELTRKEALAASAAYFDIEGGDVDG